MFRSRRRPWRGFQTLALLVLVPVLGCAGVINPALVTTLGGNPVSVLPSLEGFTHTLLMNLSDSSIVVRRQLRFYNDEVVVISDPLNTLEWKSFTHNCNLAGYQVVNISIASPGGGDPIDGPANVAELLADGDFFCGSLIAITFQGISPNIEISIEVF